VWLKGLHLLTGLQHLAVQLRYPPAAAAGYVGGFNNPAVLHQAIPDLTRLTTLHLEAAAAHDTALEHLSKLTRLQELELTSACWTVTEVSFRELPHSLTRLKLSFEDYPDGNNGPEIHIRYFVPPPLLCAQSSTALRLSLVWLVLS
jgi:hypothetical protein